MKVRRKGLATVGAAFALAALVAVIGAAQAAPPGKIYSATVHVTAPAEIDTGAGTANLTLTLTNESKNTLGSAEFKPRTGVTVVPFTDGRPTTDPDWTANYDEASGSVRLLSTAPLIKGESVSTDVEVTFAGCTDARWDTRAKQSNDFSGNPGNDFTLSSNASLSNLRPLGSFDMTGIGTEVDDPNQTEDVFVPQIEVSTSTTFDVTAYDICGEVHTSYGSGFGDSASFDADPDIPERLVEAVPADPTWVGGTDTVTLTPAVVETGDFLVLADEVTEISFTSNEFDVVKELCTAFGTTTATTCELESPGGGKIRVQAPKPPAPVGADVPSLGLGFNPNLPTFDCDGASEAVGDTFVNINPRDYPENATVKVTLTYDKSIPGISGPAADHALCLSKTNGLDWAFANPVPSCGTDTPVLLDAPCIIEQKKDQGNLRIVLFIKADDPWGGMT